MLEVIWKVVRSVLAVLKVFRFIFFLCAAISIGALGGCGKSAEEVRAERIRKEEADSMSNALERMRKGESRQSTWKPPTFQAPNQKSDQK